MIFDIMKQQEEAKAAALKHVVTMLQIPDQLDKVRTESKKLIFYCCQHMTKFYYSAQHP